MENLFFIAAYDGRNFSPIYDMVLKYELYDFAGE